MDAEVRIPFFMQALSSMYALFRFVAPLISPLAKNTRRANKIFGPYLEERLRLSEEHGNNWEDKPVSLVLGYRCCLIEFIYLP